VRESDFYIYVMGYYSSYVGIRIGIENPATINIDNNVEIRLASGDISYISIYEHLI